MSFPNESGQAKKNKKVVFTDLGLISYEEALAVQLKSFDAIISTKIANRDLSDQEKKSTDNHLFFCQHPHVYTLGRSGDIEHLLINSEELEMRNASFYKSSRGGDITYHGPGQLVGYPVFDLDNFFTDIHRYMRTLEEAVICTLQDFDIKGERIPGLTGVWVNKESQPGKICAFGVKTSRWVTMHGFSLNVSTDLSYFKYIVPCGIADKAVTSMQQELNKPVEVSEVSERLQVHLSRLFQLEIKTEIRTDVY